MKNEKLDNKYVEEFRELCVYLKDGLKNHLSSLSYPKEKISITGWIFYFSYIVCNISVLIGILSIFLLPHGAWMLFAMTGIMSAFICFSIIMTYEPK